VAFRLDMVAASLEDCDWRLLSARRVDDVKRM
jgi:hypothetical protein